MEGQGRRVMRIVGGLRRDLQIFQQGDSYVIGIRATAEDPALAAEIANVVANQYIAGQVAERAEGTRRATAWLETRVADLRGQVADAEGAVEEHRSERLALDGGGLDTVAQQLVATSGQVALARADHAGAQARHDQIRDVVEEEGFAAAAEVLSSPLVISLREERAALLRQEADLATRYGETHPARESLRAEIERVDEDLAEEVSKIIESLGNEVEVARIREESMRSDLLALEERVSSISGASIDLRHLEREASALRDVYQSFLSRLKETRAQEALAQAEARIIERAETSGAPSYPRTKLLVAAGGVVGGALGLGLALILELGSSTLRSARQAERETGLPVLASLPRGRLWRTPPQGLRALVSAPHSSYGERIRQLRTALMFGGGEPPRSILVASSLPGEGKTTTTLALAHMNALMGKSVIVLDCDFRRATLNASFRWTEDDGLAALLRGEVGLDEAIVTSTGLGFDVLPTAEPVANVADLLSPTRFRELVDELNDRYDIVLVDAPPVLPVSDACVMARSVDSVIYLVRWGSTSIAAVRQGLGSLAEVGVEPTGLVMTMVDSKRASEPVQGDYAYGA